ICVTIARAIRLLWNPFGPTLFRSSKIWWLIAVHWIVLLKPAAMFRLKPDPRLMLMPSRLIRRYPIRPLITLLVLDVAPAWPPARILLPHCLPALNWHI